jgi:hypothetical protein
MQMLALLIVNDPGFRDKTRWEILTIGAEAVS